MNGIVGSTEKTSPNQPTITSYNTEHRNYNVLLLLSKSNLTFSFHSPPRCRWYEFSIHSMSHILELESHSIWWLSGLLINCNKWKDDWNCDKECDSERIKVKTMTTTRVRELSCELTKCTSSFIYIFLLLFGCSCCEDKSNDLIRVSRCFVLGNLIRFSSFFSCIYIHSILSPICRLDALDRTTTFRRDGRGRCDAFN